MDVPSRQISDAREFISVARDYAGKGKAGEAEANLAKNRAITSLLSLFDGNPEITKHLEELKAAKLNPLEKHQFEKVLVELDEKINEVAKLGIPQKPEGEVNAQAGFGPGQRQFLGDLKNIMDEIHDLKHDVVTKDGLKPTASDKFERINDIMGKIQSKLFKYKDTEEKGKLSKELSAIKPDRKSIDEKLNGMLDNLEILVEEIKIKFEQEPLKFKV
jgi:hypothetical protein